MKHIVIQGAGITGLATAWFLHKSLGDAVKITILEKSNRVGGWIRTIDTGEFLFEAGPRGFRPSGKGELTLQLIEDLNLTKELIPADSQAKKRYLYTKNALQALTPLFLLKIGLLKSLLRDRFFAPKSQEEESIYAFFERRFGSTLADTLIDPLTKGIFGGSAKKLALKATFPTLLEWECRYGSVVRGLLATRSRSPHKRPSLYSFKNGMETLPKALVAAMPVEVIYNHDATTYTIQGDVFLNALPPTRYPLKSLQVVHLGYKTHVLTRKGYGYLIPSKENEKILGMTWDSQIFPQQNKNPEETRLTVMVPEEEDALPVSLEATQRHLGIVQKPSYISLFLAQYALPQFEVGLPLPERGVGINACITYAKHLADKTKTQVLKEPVDQKK